MLEIFVLTSLPATLALPCTCTPFCTAVSATAVHSTVRLGAAEFTLQRNLLVASISRAVWTPQYCVIQGPDLWRREMQPYGCNRRRVLRNDLAPSVLPPLIGQITPDGSH